MEPTAMNRYLKIANEAPNPSGRDSILTYLNRALPPLWEADYQAMTSSPSALLTVTFREPQHADSELNVLFDHASFAAGASSHGTEDRVVAVWGLSRSEPAGTRDKQRMAGYLRDVWSDTYPGYDRGHFFAHTMGGGTDINLFPQLASVNRGGRWRELETYAASHPGTFCFIHPIYVGTSWIPARLEYGIFHMPPEAFRFEGATFAN
jgi:hypothetical protein